MIRKLFEKISIKKAFKASIRQDLYNNFACRASTNLAIDDSLKRFSALFIEKKIKTGIYLHEISETVDSGSSLSTALKGYVPSAEIAIIYAGEQNTETQAQSFADVAMLVEKMAELLEQFKSTMIITTIKFLIIMCFLIVIGRASVGILSTLEIENYPWFTTAMITFGTHISKFWLIYLILFFALVGLLFYRLPRGAGKFRSYLQYRVFPFTVYRKMISSSFLVSFGALLNNNYSTAEAVNALKISADPYLYHYLHLMHESASEGMNEETIFSHDLFDPFLQINLIDLVSINASGDVIKKLAEHELKDTKKEFENVNSRISLVMLLFMTIAVVWAAASFMVPVLDMASNASASF